MTSTEGIEMDEPLWTVPEAAQILTVPKSWLYYATKRGDFPCVRVGRHVRIRRSDVRAWIADGGHGVEDST